MNRLTARSLAAIPLLLAAWGCAAPAAPPATPSPSVGPSAIPSVGPSTPPASGSPAPVPSVAPSPAPTASPAPVLDIDTIAVVVTGGLRVRSLPEVSTASKKLEPLLDGPRRLFVVAGPVEGSGYTWYQVAPIRNADEFGDLPFGWVAAADKDGTPWIAASADPCPPVPTDAAALYGLNGLVALACFGDREISVPARLAQPEATCGVDIGWSIDPDWLASTCPQPRFLVEPVSGAPIDANSVIDPKVDVSRFAPGVEPADWIKVRLSGHFDHTDAMRCKGVSNGNPVPFQRDQIVVSCRATFVITGIAPA